MQKISNFLRRLKRRSRDLNWLTTRATSPLLLSSRAASPCTRKTVHSGIQVSQARARFHRSEEQQTLWQPARRITEQSGLANNCRSISSSDCHYPDRFRSNNSL